MRKIARAIEGYRHAPLQESPRQIGLLRAPYLADALGSAFMPAPMLTHIADAEKQAMPPIVGFTPARRSFRGGGKEHPRHVEVE